MLLKIMYSCSGGTNQTRFYVFILCMLREKKAVTFQDSLGLKKYFASYIEDNISVCI